MAKGRGVSTWVVAWLSWKAWLTSVKVYLRRGVAWLSREAWLSGGGGGVLLWGVAK
jgi:hypothetical protein